MINTITFNPAMDKILYVESLQRNFSNRIQKTESCLGGKGTHLSCNLGLLGIENRSFGVAFGATGKEVIRILESYGVRAHYIYREEGETRTNYLVVEQDGSSTFFNERGQMLNPDIVDELTALIAGVVEMNDVIVVAGDASNVEDKGVMLEIVRSARKKNVCLYLDSSGEFLRQAVQFEPFLIKPNMDELSELVLTKINTVEEAAQAISTIPNIPAIMVSMGEDGWLFKYNDRLIRGYGLTVPVGNVVGCGDALLTGLIWGFEYSGLGLEEILRYATALSATCAMSNLTMGFDIEAAKRLQSEVKLEFLK